MSIEGNLDLQPGARGRNRGRKSKDGGEEIPKFDTIKEAAGEMMRAHKRLEQARESFNDCVKKVAERSNVNAASLKKLIRASAGGNFKDEQRKVDQQSTLFEMVGEIQGAPETQ
jgi:hypothetical protein